MKQLCINIILISLANGMLLGCNKQENIKNFDLPIAYALIDFPAKETTEHVLSRLNWVTQPFSVTTPCAKLHVFPVVKLYHINSKLNNGHIKITQESAKLIKDNTNEAQKLMGSAPGFPYLQELASTHVKNTILPEEFFLKSSNENSKANGELNKIISDSAITHVGLKSNGDLNISQAKNELWKKNKNIEVFLVDSKFNLQEFTKSTVCAKDQKTIIPSEKISLLFFEMDGNVDIGQAELLLNKEANDKKSFDSKLTKHPERPTKPIKKETNQESKLQAQKNTSLFNDPLTPVDAIRMRNDPR